MLYLNANKFAFWSTPFHLNLWTIQSAYIKPEGTGDHVLSSKNASGEQRKTKFELPRTTDRDGNMECKKWNSLPIQKTEAIMRLIKVNISDYKVESF